MSMQKELNAFISFISMRVLRGGCCFNSLVTSGLIEICSIINGNIFAFRLFFEAQHGIFLSNWSIGPIFLVKD